MLKAISFFFLLAIILLSTCQLRAQKKDKIKHLKYGLQISTNARNNFYFSNENYALKINTLKLQSFYKLKTIKDWDFNLILQPQFQLMEHKLLNKFFIQPDDFDGNFLEYREKFTQPNHLSLYAFELGFQLTRHLFKDIRFEFTAGLGMGYIDFTTERLVRGFTFIENLSFGLSKSFDRIEIYSGFVLSHISNFDIKLPNSGYNTIGLELSMRFLD